MGLDIRIPIGLMFVLIGLVISVYGLFTLGNTEMYVKSLNINVNLWSGISMTLFGIVMLISSNYSKKK